MLGNMQDGQLLISGLIEHAEIYHTDTEIVSRTVEGPIHRYTLKDAANRSRKLANALGKLGLQQGDVVGTLAWNTFRHFELYFGVSGIGCVVNTVNPRLFPEQLTYIINHAANKYLFVDLTFVPLVESISDSLEGIKGIIVLTDKENMPETELKNVICYEELIADEPTKYDWPVFDENTASSLCYTSGTTGNPKGVLYSHRSTLLHTWIVSSGNVGKVSSSSVILPVVPMFHVNAWGIPYASAMFGAKLVLPGPMMDGASIFELIDQEKPDLLMGVPTVWLGLLQYLKETNQTLDSVTTALVGGSAAPRAMIQEFEEKHDVFLMHGWGMTEMSPLGTATSRTAEMDNMDIESRYDLQEKQGKAFFGVEMTIADDEGNELPKDGIAFGRLLVKGPTIVERYFKSNESSLDENGWFDTGDVAKIHPEGSMEIVDRSKDVIKSGGEWISSIDLENAAVGHPEVAEACVIGVLHKKWDERPLLLIVKVDGKDPSREEILTFLEDKVAKWWMPDDVIFVSELPHTATGKLLKTDLRDEYKEHLIKSGE
jgi:fatty-acyl-CoA synthase